MYYKKHTRLEQIQRENPLLTKHGLIYVYAAATIWSTIGVAAKLGYASGANPHGVALTRSLFVFIIFSAMYLTRYRSLEIDFKPIFFGLFIIAPFHFSYMNAVDKLGVALAVVLLYTAPIWVVIISALVYRDIPSKWELLAVFLSILGIVLIYYPLEESISITITGLVYGLLSGFLYGLFIVLSKYILLGGYEEWNSAKLVVLAVTVQAWAFPTLFLSYITTKGLVLSRADILSGAYLGIVSSIIAYYLFYKGLSTITPSTASIAATLEPLLAVLWGVILFQEYLSYLRWIGSLLIISSQLLLSRK